MFFDVNAIMKNKKDQVHLPPRIKFWNNF